MSALSARARYALHAYRAAPVTFVRRVVLGRDPYWRQYFWSRWGFVPADVVARVRGRRVLLVDALSGGEITQMVSFCQGLRQRLPGWAIVVSTQNKYAFDFALANLDVDAVIDAPWDCRAPVRRTLARLGPAALVTVQTAFAATLVREARRRGVPTVLVSGLMTKRVEQHPMYARVMERPPFADFDAVGAWADDDVRGFVRYGARPDAVRVTGNMKFDLDYLHVSAVERAKLREALALEPEEPVFLGASLHPGEEAFVIDAYRDALRGVPGLRLVLVPRYQKDAGQAVAALSARGMSLALKSRLATGGAPRDATIVVDTFGELARLYAIASVTFLGGSTYARNVLGLGQNPIEPLVQGHPFFFGPFMNLWTELTGSLKEVLPAVEVTSSQELGARIVDVLTDDALRARLTARMDELLSAHRHDVARNVDLVVETIAARYGALS